MLAVAASLGAAAARPVAGVALAALAALGTAAIATGKGWRAAAAVALVASGLGARAWAGLAPPATEALVAATVTLVDDPRPIGPGVGVTVRWGSRRLDAQAFGRAAAALRPRAAGEVVVLDGVVRALTGTSRRRAAYRHVAARIDVAVVRDWRPGAVVGEAANRVRRSLAHGTRVLPAADASLVRGFVLGDDRDEPAALVAAFRASGLAHLTAVSGENVAFVLVVLGPVLRRLGLRARWGTTVAVVAWFALLTRFEPSVVRACAMAALAATARYAARPAAPLRLLALAVAGLTLVDPLLVHSAGWWLSVGATAGLAVCTDPIAASVPGPRWLAEPLAATLAAQLGVLPVELAVFGTAPLLAVPANLLAGPAAAFVMVWGLPAGIVAGLAPAWVAHIVHVPTLVLVRWIQLVALLAARAPAAPAVAVLAAVVAAASVIAHGRARRRRVGSDVS